MSMNRRLWLQHGAGVVGGITLAGCNVLDAARVPAHASAAASPSAGPVFVAGRRVTTVDVHAHCYVTEALALLGAEADAVLPPVKGVPEHFIVVEQRLRAMDAMRVDMEILSINPFWYRRERAISERIVRTQNEKLAELCAKAPERLGALPRSPCSSPRSPCGSSSTP